MPKPPSYVKNHIRAFWEFTCKGAVDHREDGPAIERPANEWDWVDQYEWVLDNEQMSYERWSATMFFNRNSKVIDHFLLNDKTGVFI